MTIKEFKKFVAEIPEEFDDVELAYVDFSYADSLQVGFQKYENGYQDAIITDWGGDKHIYWKQHNDNVIKSIPVR